LNFKRILIPVDGSPISAHAASVGLELARDLRAETAMVYVVEPPVPYSGEIGIPPEELLQLAGRESEAVFDALREHGDLLATAARFVRVGHAADVIEKLASEWSADMIVIGSHGRGGVGRALLGSVADAVVRHAPCPVLVVRREA